MTEQQGRGVQTMAQLVEDLSHLDQLGARALFDGLTDQQAADVLAAQAGALDATGEPSEFTASIASRLDDQQVSQ